MKKLLKYLLGTLLFLLPFQTRWIYQPAFIDGNFWEYGTQSIYGTEILLWAIIVIFSYINFRNKEVWKKTFSRERFKTHKKNLFFVLIFVLFWLTSIGFSPQKAITINFFLHFIEALCLGLIVALFEDKKYLQWAFWSGGVLQSLFAIQQFFTQNVSANKWLSLAAQSAGQLGSGVVETTHERWLRAYGTLGGPNPLGMYLGLIFFIGLLLYLDSKPWQKIVLTTGQSLILIGLFFSFSRGAWIACTFGAIVLAVILLRENNRAHNLLIMLKLIIFSLLILVTLFFISKQTLLTRFNPTVRLETQSLVERQSQIQQAVQIFKQYPWFGSSPGIYTLKLYQLNSQLPIWKLLPVHNIYLLALAETGIIGFVLFVWLIIFLLKKIYQTNPRYLAVLTALLAAGLFEHFFWSLYVGQMLFWTIFALGFKIKSFNTNQ